MWNVDNCSLDAVKTQLDNLRLPLPVGWADTVAQGPNAMRAKLGTIYRDFIAKYGEVLDSEVVRRLRESLDELQVRPYRQLNLGVLGVSLTRLGSLA